MSNQKLTWSASNPNLFNKKPSLKIITSDITQKTSLIESKTSIDSTKSIKSDRQSTVKQDPSKTDYAKRLVYENQTAHSKYLQLEKNFHQLQISKQNLAEQYSSLKLALINLNMSRNRQQGFEQPELYGEDECNLEDLDTLKILYQFQLASKSQLQEQHRALQAQYNSLKNSTQHVNTSKTYSENLAKLEQQNRQLRQMIKKMSDIVAADGKAPTI